MISTDLRNLKASIKAHAEHDMLTPAFLKCLLAKLDDAADRVEALEQTQVPPRLLRPRQQLELIDGGRP